ncbi:MAG: elongation factor G [Nitrospirae bacterium]|nr:MAG: elongation factor G [Nitrospirota bacterium]
MSYPGVDKVLNMGIIAHGGAGKTTLVESILFDTKTIDRMGRVEEGNTTTDFEPEEIKHKFSISSSLAYCNHKGYKIHIVDTPGYGNFLEDTKLSMSAVDSVIFVLSSIPGIKAETKKLWRYADDFKLPRIIFVNEMDRDNANLMEVIKNVESAYKTRLLLLQLPIGVGDSFEGVVDLLGKRALRFKDGNVIEGDIPEDMLDDVENYREKLIESAVEVEDELLEKYLEEGEVTEDEIKGAIKRGTITGAFIPVVCGSALKNIGVHTLLDAAIMYLPNPLEAAEYRPVKGKHPDTGDEITLTSDESAPLVAQVFKTIADPFAGRLSIFRVYSGTLSADSTVLNDKKNTKEKIGQVFYLLGKQHIPAQRVGPGELAAVAKLKDTITGDTLCSPSAPVVLENVTLAEPIISFAIEPKRREDEEKVSAGLHRIQEEDPSIKFYRDEETKEMLISGMGQLHVELTLEKLKRKFGVEVVMKSPKIPYKETIKSKSKAQGKYKKQSGGRGQYGDCWIEIEPLERGRGFEFIDKIVGGVIPKQYIPAVEKGVLEAMKEGVVAGYPVVDVRVILYDGSYHPVDSSEMAFKIAGSMAFKKAMQQDTPVLLEPIMKVEVTTPEEYLGSVIGDLNARRARVQGVDSEGDNQIITAYVPMAEMLTYANQLNSITSAQGMYTMEFSHYEEVPAHISQKIIEQKLSEESE